MMGKKRPLAFVCGISLFVCLSVASFAQENTKILLANIKQDLELVDREVAGLRSEVEMLRRENVQLKMAIDQADRSRKQDKGTESTLVLEMQNRLQVLELTLKQSERARNSMQDELNKKFQQIIEQMNRGFEQVSASASASKESNAPSFSSDYPKNGFVHKVEKGETVSSIAQKYKSKVSWIINANQIADPTKVFVGRELFVPQK
ncbi:MAG: LysM peptidoglycan-binding domain-containing protein [Opitutales bacterium]|nr:LysM peptidoglycan-binding domain-containing protein [Opitutales bacterium]